MGAAGSGTGRGTYWPPFPAAPIGQAQRTAANGSRDRPNLWTQQLHMHIFSSLLRQSLALRSKIKAHAVKDS
ncbi:hypothetical protein UY3_06448 [Chelonia mydas]|uniref:Uncharacterized protein n=1 Tax=Chelonia mydas TaxID=8469 RepID=M7BGQ6_CHEMY|nr:hypothetical protein UY3_06448 [Chelonia mydas]